MPEPRARRKRSIRQTGNEIAAAHPHASIILVEYSRYDLSVVQRVESISKQSLARCPGVSSFAALSTRRLPHGDETNDWSRCVLSFIRLVSLRGYMELILLNAGRTA